MKKSEKMSIGHMGWHQANICQIVIPEEENKKRTESIFKEIMAVKFPKLRKEGSGHTNLWIPKKSK